MARKIISTMFKETISCLFKKTATGKYPFVKCIPAEGFKGKQVFDTDICIGCSLCSRDCPAKAIEMVDAGGKKRPLFFLDRCVFCYQCAESCPRNAIKTSIIFELATTNKSDLLLKPEAPHAVKPAAPQAAVKQESPQAVQQTSKGAEQ